MKVLLHVENIKGMNKSGLGQAVNHQKKALDLVGVPYTLDKNDNYDLAHINFYLFESVKLAKRLKKKANPLSLK